MPVITEHGAKQLPSVEVDSYNLEIKDEEGFIGDRASRSAFFEIIDEWREPLRKLGADPLGDQVTEELSKKELDALLAGLLPEGVDARELGALAFSGALETDLESGATSIRNMSAELLGGLATGELNVAPSANGASLSGAPVKT